VSCSHSRSDLADQLLHRFGRTLTYLPFLLGEVPVYVDFALYGIIGNLTYKGLNELSADQGRLRDWYQRVREFRYS